jgi:hypothetical protein
MPNITFDTLDVVPDGLKEHAKKDEASGKFLVSVVPEVKLNEFRDTNVRVSQERDALGVVVQKIKPLIGDDIDAFIAQYTELATMSQQVKDGKLKASGDIEAEVLNRVASMKTGFETQLTQAQQALVAERNARVEATTKYNRSIIDQNVTQAVITPTSGANPEALNDILTRAYGVFQVQADGKLIAKDGEAIIYGVDGATPMTPMEWMTKLRVQAPYLFNQSGGGGANGGQQGGGTAERGGMTKEAFNALSPEARLRIYHKAKDGKQAA